MAPSLRETLSPFLCLVSVWVVLAGEAPSSFTLDIVHGSDSSLKVPLVDLFSHHNVSTSTNGTSRPSFDSHSKNEGFQISLAKDDLQRVEGAPLIDEDILIHFGSRWEFLLDDINQTTHKRGRAMIEPYNLTEAFNLESTSDADNKYLVIPKKLVEDCFSFANQKWVERQRKIDNVFITNTGADSKSPIGTAFAFNPPNAEALALSNTSILLEFASLSFLDGIESESNARVKRQALLFMDESAVPLERKADRLSPRSLDIRPFVPSASRRQGQFGSMQCGVHDEVLPCDPNNPYRTYSGWCNNIRNPGWGKSVITFDRMIPAAYADGVSRPRSTSVTGVPLPSPRHISRYVHVDVSHLSNRHTLMLMQYAQFLDHDLTLTPVHKGPQEKILNCRDCESQSSTHPECWPIPVPQGDSWYPAAHENGKPYCIPFTRSLPGQQRLGPREQINQNSAYIDASQIYGENVCKADSLRIPGGKLNATNMNGGKSLMPQTGTLRECKSPSGYCFYAGDPRASEQPALAAVHTVFMRQHNQWADGLKRVNPHWTDEKIYQGVRRIMGAVNQHLAYNELLPRILGAPMVNAYGLGLQSDGYYAGYDAGCSVNIYNEFATAAFRFGHSLIRPNLARMDGRYHGMNPHVQLRDGFFNSDMFYKPLMVDEITRGLLAEPMEQLDPFITNEITNHLFEDKKKPFSGLDLISLNIHRARDHGLKGYNSYRAVCSLKKATTFAELATEIPDDVLQRLQKVYAHVDDIDLFTGSLVERPVKGGMLGPVMTCIIGTQFKRLRQCDRFWYETNNPATRFTPQQLAEIRKMTLSKIVCDNMDVPTDTQKMAFDAPHNVLNPRVPCDRLPALNLEAWRESPSTAATASVPRPQALTATKGCNIAGKLVAVGAASLQSPCVSCVCTPQGSKCASLRVTSCEKLVQEAQRNEIMKDTVCTSQCGFYLGQRAPAQSQPFISRIPSNHGSRLSG